MTKEQRDEQRSKEMLQHPIFLFQARRYFVFESPEDYFHDGEGYVRGELVNNCWQRAPGTDDESYLTGKQLEQMDCAKEMWETERVFLSREEGVAYGNAKDYNYRNGWRVYSVPCHGELATLLDLK